MEKLKYYTLLILFLPFVSQAQDNPLMQLFDAIPAPAEMVGLIKDTDKDYDKSILHETGQAENYSTDFKKAVNFGIYSTDLGYATIYEQPLTELSPYLSDVETLADGLGVGEYININSLAPVALSGDITQLMISTQQIFHQITKDLEEKGQSDLAAAIFFGGWLEGVYIACQTLDAEVDDEANNNLKVRVAQQFIVSTMLLEELENPDYASSESLQIIKTDLTKIHNVFGTIVDMETLDEPKIDDVESVKNIVSVVRVVRRGYTEN